MQIVALLSPMTLHILIPMTKSSTSTGFTRELVDLFHFLKESSILAQLGGGSTFEGICVQMLISSFVVFMCCFNYTGYIKAWVKHWILFSNFCTAVGTPHLLTPIMHILLGLFLTNTCLLSFLFSVDFIVEKHRHHTAGEKDGHAAVQTDRQTDLSSCRTLWTVCPLMMNTSVISSVSILQE